MDRFLIYFQYHVDVNIYCYDNSNGIFVKKKRPEKSVDISAIYIIFVLLF